MVNIVNSNNAKIYLFCCATSYEQADITRNMTQTGIETKVVSIPCSGKLDILYLTKAFETGADGVAVMICKQGDCRYLEGNLRAKKRIAAVEELLEETGSARDGLPLSNCRTTVLPALLVPLRIFVSR